MIKYITEQPIHTKYRRKEKMERLFISIFVHTYMSTMTPLHLFLTLTNSGIRDIGLTECQRGPGDHSTNANCGSRIKFQVEIKKDKTYPLYFKDNLSNLPVKFIRHL